MDGARRFLLAAGTADYPNLSPARQLPSVRDDLARIGALFGRLGAEPVATGGVNPTSNELVSAVEDWLKADEERSPSDVLVLYYSGHGVSGEDETHYLYTTDTHDDRLESTAVATERLARTLAGSRVRQLLVLLDTCYAGEGADDLAAAAAKAVKRRPADPDEDDDPSRLGTGLWFVAAARRTEEADEGAFVEALAGAVDDERFAGARLPYLDLNALVGAVNTELRRRGRRQRVVVDAVGVTGPCVALVNPRYQPQVAALPEGVSVAEQRRLADLAHWDPRARGVAVEADAGWYFTGRTAALEELTAWLIDPAPRTRLKVVTGRPGSGKSAVLARLVTLSDPIYRARIPSATLSEGPEVPEGVIDQAVVAKGKTLADLIAELAHAAQVDTTGPEALVRALALRPGRWTLVVDALDEATEPELIARKLLVPLAQASPPGDVRVLVGVRPHLLAMLGPGQVEQVDLDHQRYLDRADLEGYVARYLEGEPGSPYHHQPTDTQEAAAAIAAKAGQSFLIARVYAGMFATAPTQVDVTSPAWQQRPHQLGQVLEQDLARLGPDTGWTRDLLRPLAYAEGAGLPWEDLWAPLASALADPARAYTDDDLRRLLQVAGSYVVEATEHGRSLYRLYHQAFAEHLRPPDREQAAQQAITRTLLAQSPQRSDGPGHNWTQAHPYLRTHLATHAAAAGLLDELLDDPWYLAAATPDRLLRVVGQARTPSGRQAAGVYQRAAHLLRADAPERNAAYLELIARQVGEDQVADQIERLAVPRPWATRWAHGRPSQPHYLAGRHDSSVRTVAVGTLPDGRPVIVSGGDDGTVRVWELASGKPIGKPIDHGSGVRARQFSGVKVTAVAVGTLADGRPVVVSGDNDGTVWVWELASGAPIGEPRTGHTREVTALAVGRLPDGRPVIVSGSDDETVRVWELASGTPIGKPVGHHSPVRALALGTLPDGRPVVISGSWHGVWVWELASGTPISDEPRTGHVDAVAVGTLADGRPVVVSGSVLGVWVWELASGAPIGERIDVRGWVRAVAVGTLPDGRPVVISGSTNGVAVWELASGAPVGEPRTDHTDDVNALAVGALPDGRQVVISGSSDRTVRAWELTSDAPPSAPRTDHTDAVKTVAVGTLRDGRPVVVSGAHGVVRVWELASGAPIGGPVRHGGGSVLAVGMLSGGRPMVVVDGGRGTVRVRKAGGWPFKRGPRVPGSALAVGRLPDGRLAVVCGASRGTVWVQKVGGWPFKRLLRLYVYGRSREGVDAVAVGTLPDGRPVVISASYRTMRVWELASGALIGELKHHGSRVNVLAVGTLPDSRPVIVSGDNDGTVRVWELASGSPIGEPRSGHTHAVTALAMGTLPDRRQVVVSGSTDGTIRVWELTHEAPLDLIDLNAAVYSLAFATERTLIVGGLTGVFALDMHLGET